MNGDATRQTIERVIAVLFLGAFVWVGIAHLEDDASKRSVIAKAGRAELKQFELQQLANEKALMAHDGIPYVVVQPLGN